MNDLRLREISFSWTIVNGSIYELFIDVSEKQGSHLLHLFTAIFSTIHWTSLLAFCWSSIFCTCKRVRQWFSSWNLFSPHFQSPSWKFTQAQIYLERTSFGAMWLNISSWAPSRSMYVSESMCIPLNYWHERRKRNSRGFQIYPLYRISQSSMQWLPNLLTAVYSFIFQTRLPAPDNLWSRNICSCPAPNPLHCMFPTVQKWRDVHMIVLHPRAACIRCYVLTGGVSAVDLAIWRINCTPHSKIHRLLFPHTAKPWSPKHKFRQ